MRIEASSPIESETSSLFLDHALFVMDLVDQAAISPVQFRVEDEFDWATFAGDPGVTFFRVAGTQQHPALGRIEARCIDRVVDRLVAIRIAAVGLKPHCGVMI